MGVGVEEVAQVVDTSDVVHPETAGMKAARQMVKTPVASRSHQDASYDRLGSRAPLAATATSTGAGRKERGAVEGEGSRGRRRCRGVRCALQL